MAWFAQFTRFGDVHLVLGQEEGCPCGPSAALMRHTKITKLQLAASRFDDTHPFQKKYEQWLGKPYHGQTEGTWPDGLLCAQLLANRRQRCVATTNENATSLTRGLLRWPQPFEALAKPTLRLPSSAKSANLSVGVGIRQMSIWRSA